MEIRVFSQLPEAAKIIRKEVFVEEQGFEEEFDEIDAAAKHLVLYDGKQAVGTCRVFFSGCKGEYIVGRVAVAKERRGEHLGERLMKAAEDTVRDLGGRRVKISAQVQAKGFYETLGYRCQGEIYLDEFCPHITMVKGMVRNGS